MKLTIKKWTMQVGHLNRGINPSSVNRLNFDPKYIAAPIKAGILTAVLALAVRPRTIYFYVHFTVIISIKIIVLIKPNVTYRKE